ncbi:hypothetical protein ACEQ8H_006530 [Pleosporales sp. CAS-2024a]
MTLAYGFIGIEAMSRLSKMINETSDAHNYTSMAHDYIAQWHSSSRCSTHVFTPNTFHTANPLTLSTTSVIASARNHGVTSVLC